MSDKQWEPLTTAEAVIEAIKAGRHVEFTACGCDYHAELAGWIDPEHIHNSRELLVDVRMALALPGCRYRALIAPAQPAADVDPAIPAGFKPWGGSIKPVFFGGGPDEASGKKVFIYFRRGSICHDVMLSDSLNWQHSGSSDDIIAYRVAEPEDVDPADAELADAIAKGTEAWAGTHDGWADELRGGAVEPARTGWQPIETAPKDGRTVLLYCPHGDGSPGSTFRVTCGEWIEDEGGITEHRDIDGRWIGQDESDGFTGWMSADGGFSEDTMMPTHWMPLPEPPND